MFQTEDIIGDVVFVSLVNEQEFQSIGITRSGHYLVKGLDNKGLWLQHPGITTNNQEITSYIKEGIFLVLVDKNSSEFRLLVDERGRLFGTC